MLTTALMGGLGFIFWLIATHLFTPDEIGIGTTLISAMSLISFISLLGFNSTFVRILPNSKNRNVEINTGSILVMLAAALIAAAYIYIIPYITPSLGIIRNNIWYSLGFIVMVALASLNSLTDSIFLAFRSTQYNFITDGIITGGTRLLLPLVFATLGAYGVFASSGLAASIGMLASVFFLVQKFGYRPSFIIHWETLKKVFKYSFANYLANLLTISPTLILPILILGQLGAATAGYFYLSFMIMNLLYTVSGSISQSLFAEGSYGEHSLIELIKRTTIFLLAIMVPAAIILAVFGPYVLAIFGKSYSSGGAGVIAVLALAAPAVAAFNVGSTLLRIRHQIYSLVFINLVYAASICLFSLYWIHGGLVWVAGAWLVGNVLASLLCFIFLFIYRGKATPLQGI
jgi:O-antigen/teichoic acid export membrane protein